MRDIPMPASDAATAGEIISRIGQLTRMLRDSMRELGLDQAIARRQRRSRMRATVLTMS